MIIARSNPRRLLAANSQDQSASSDCQAARSARTREGVLTPAGATAVAAAFLGLAHAVTDALSGVQVLAPFYFADVNEDVPAATVRSAVGPDETEAAIGVVLDDYPVLFFRAGF
jgi:hypothetical protein